MEETYYGAKSIADTVTVQSTFDQTTGWNLVGGSHNQEISGYVDYTVGSTVQTPADGQLWFDGTTNTLKVYVPNRPMNRKLLLL